MEVGQIDVLPLCLLWIGHRGKFYGRLEMNVVGWLYRFRELIQELEDLAS